MNLIQIYGADGGKLGLFTHDRDDDLQPLIDLCQSRAETVYESRDVEDYDDLLDLFFDELDEEGFIRVFVQECNIEIF